MWLRIEDWERVALFSMEDRGLCDLDPGLDVPAPPDPWTTPLDQQTTHNSGFTCHILIDLWTLYILTCVSQ